MNDTQNPDPQDLYIKLVETVNDLQGAISAAMSLSPDREARVQEALKQTRQLFADANALFASLQQQLTNGQGKV